MSKREDNKVRKVVSLKERERFLDEKEFTNNLGSYSKDEELFKALSSQGAWSKYERNGFISLSLNTYKSLAEDNLYIGFEGIDKKREKALQLLAEYLNAKGTPKREVRADSKSGIKAKSKAKDKQLSVLREANMVLSKGIAVTVHALEKLKKETRGDKTSDIVQSELVKIKALLRRYERLDQEDERLERE